jgi:hypothetical protein
MDFFKAQLIVLGLFTLVLSVLSRFQGGGPSRDDSKAAISLQARYLSVYGLLMASDWLQGAYLYAAALSPCRSD